MMCVALFCSFFSKNIQYLHLFTLRCIIWCWICHSSRYTENCCRNLNTKWKSRSSRTGYYIFIIQTSQGSWNHKRCFDIRFPYIQSSLQCRFAWYVHILLFYQNIHLSSMTNNISYSLETLLTF